MTTLLESLPRALRALVEAPLTRGEREAVARLVKMGLQDTQTSADAVRAIRDGKTLPGFCNFARIVETGCECCVARLKRLARLESGEWCAECEQDIDPRFCWCGTEIRMHTASTSHAPVAMGCCCRFDERTKREAKRQRDWREYQTAQEREPGFGGPECFRGSDFD